MNIDHVVLWVADPKTSLEFYSDVLGLAPVRRARYEAGEVGFPSVRINETTIIDLMSKDAAANVGRFTGGSEASAGHPVNHVCLSMSAGDYAAVEGRLAARGIRLTFGGEQAFGAQGSATISNYLNDPDGNVIEIRHYDQA